MATEYIKTVKCPKCLFRNVAGTKFCGDCGALLEGSSILCGKCSFENTQGTKFCGNCGNNIENTVENDPDIRHLQDILRGKYVVIKALGEGGFGRVFLAEHIGLKQKHVIKLLSADSSRSAEIKSRFFQEAQVIARLKHPNIIPIMDVSEYGERPYYIMSYISGGSLAELLHIEKKLTTERTFEIVGKLLLALSEVHTKGIIHRDIKPDNILLDESGEPFLIDFGIARLLEGNKAKTGTGFSIGTPHYMSPEQLDGKHVDCTTDIYSFGIMLFELLSGKPPFEGSLSSLVTQHSTSELPLIGSLISYSEISNDIQKILQKACAKEPVNRFRSALEFRDALLSINQTKPKLNSESERLEKDHLKRIDILLRKEEELLKRENIIHQDLNGSPTSNALKILNPLIKNFTNSIGMEFILIPSGEFMMGAIPQDKDANENEKPQHKVFITKKFFIGKYPVTQNEWEKIIGSNPSYFKNSGKKAPVENVSWNVVMEYIKLLNQIEGRNYRLPTEAEWEYSSRAGLKTISPLGELSDSSWYIKNSGSTTHSIGQKISNEWGLYDTIGNIWEWCEDKFDDEYYKKSLDKDPKGSENGSSRVLRGGSWSSFINLCRFSSRISRNPNTSHHDAGFRLILDCP